MGAVMSFLGILYILTGASIQLCLNHTRVISMVIVAVSCAAVFAYKKTGMRIPFLAVALLNVSGVLSDRWHLFTALAIIDTAFGVALVVAGVFTFYRKEKPPVKKILYPVLLAAAAFIPVMLAAGALRVTLFPSALIDDYRKKYGGWNNTSATQEEYWLDDG